MNGFGAYDIVGVCLVVLCVHEYLVWLWYCCEDVDVILCVVLF